VFSCFIAGITAVPVNGDAVVVGANGQLGIPTAGSPLSAKELSKTHQVVQQLKATTEKQAARITLQEERIALQEGQIQTLTAALKQQAEQIQRVNAQLELSKSATQTVLNNQ
jgi:FAD synthase